MDIKQVIVMRTDLGMRKGKMIAQGAHASMAFMTNKFRYFDFAIPDETPRPIPAIVDLTLEEMEWVKGRFTKVCVRVESEQELLDIHQAALDAGLVSHLITDSGLTEFRGVPTNTCLAIGPDLSEKIDKITGHLQLL